MQEMAKPIKRTSGETSLAVILCICTLFAASAAFGWNLSLYAGIFLLGLRVLCGTPDEDFYLFAAMIPYAGLVQTGGYHILFLFLLWAAGKLLVQGRFRQYPLSYWILTIAFFGLVCIQDILYTSIGRLLYLLAVQLYTTAFILFGKLETICVQKLRAIVFFSLLLAVLFTALGSLGSNLDTEKRFGEQLRQLGGAMGLPVYCLLMLCLLFGYYLRKDISLFRRAVSVLLMAAVGAVGLLSISRVYLLGLAVLFAASLCLLGKGRTKRILTLYLAAALTAILMGTFFPQYTEKLLNAFYLRLQDRAGSGRLAIYQDCFQFFLDNPLRLLFGSGAFHYVSIGETEQLGFRAMAHNLYLDLVMSWGVSGVIYIGMMLAIFIKRLKKTVHTTLNRVYLLPSLVLAACFLTEGTFQYYNIYLYLLVLPLFFYGGEKRMEEMP